MKNLPVYILFFFIFYLTFLFSIEPLVVKFDRSGKLKIVCRILVVVGFSIVPFLIMLLFVFSL